MSLGLVLVEENLFKQMPMRTQTLQSDAIMSANIKMEFIKTQRAYHFELEYGHKVINVTTSKIFRFIVMKTYTVNFRSLGIKLFMSSKDKIFLYINTSSSINKAYSDESSGCNWWIQLRRRLNQLGNHHTRR